MELRRPIGHFWKESGTDDEPGDGTCGSRRERGCLEGRQSHVSAAELVRVDGVAPALACDNARLRCNLPVRHAPATIRSFAEKRYADRDCAGETLSFPEV